ncbi:MAG: AMP-binding protein, partial [Proteobacteria bacterium]|nr:AMP-binding protein [Pseudomonadota bacterium]
MLPLKEKRIEPIDSRPSPLFEYIEETGRTFPDKVCLRLDERADRIEYTFSDLIKTSNMLADTLLDKNLRSGDRIAIISEGRPEAVAAFLGILKSRCTPVLL